MNWRERNLMDEHIAGGRYSRATVIARCVCDKGDCGWEGEVTQHSEYGATDLEPEDCPDCGGSIEVDG